MRLQVFKSFTEDLASLSKCTERKVAAVIINAKMSQVYSIGTNGGAAGLGDCMCEVNSKYGCIHAEMNALIKCTNADQDKIMIVTLSPCRMCAAAIINAPGSFKAVYYLNEWKDTSGLTLLRSAGISTVML
jgi:deoxycytidylate deaminase